MDGGYIGKYLCRYGGFASLQPIFDYTVAETTILGLIILIAHSLPIEVAIARQSRVSAIFNLLFRFINAVIAGKILNYIFIKFELFNEKNSSILDIPTSVVSNLDWLILQSKNFLNNFYDNFFDHFNNQYSKIYRTLAIHYKYFKNTTFLFRNVRKGS